MTEYKAAFWIRRLFNTTFYSERLIFEAMCERTGHAGHADESGWQRGKREEEKTVGTAERGRCDDEGGDR
jgi:hypothetical protein